MKTVVKVSVAALALCAGLIQPVMSQQSSETTLILQSKLSSQTPGGASTYNISFGSLNQGLLSLASKPTTADGSAAFAAWYSANSRTFVSWNGVVGSSIDGSDAFVRYYGPDTSVATRAGGSLTSIFNPTQDNRALAFVSYEFAPGDGISEIGLFDLGFDWGNGANGELFPLGLYDFINLNTDAKAVYGSVNPGQGDLGTLTTSSVPEPSSASLLLLGSLALAAVRRFRKNV
jgi:hypothetical protein